MIEKAILITTSTDSEYLNNKISHINDALGLPNDMIEILFNERDHSNPVRGCYRAHIAALKSFQDSKSNNCLFLEDDVYFLKKIDQKDIFNKVPDPKWDIIYLGHRPSTGENNFVKPTETHSFTRVQTKDAHAYILSRRLNLKAIHKAWHGIPYDIVLRYYSKNSYALFPMVAIQTGKLFSPSFKNGLAELRYEHRQYVDNQKMIKRQILTMLLPFRFVVILIRLIYISNSIRIS